MNLIRLAPSKGETVIVTVPSFSMERFLFYGSFGVPPLGGRLKGGTPNKDGEHHERRYSTN
jgi:hypothetical protein